MPPAYGVPLSRLWLPLVAVLPFLWEKAGHDRGNDAAVGHDHRVFFPAFQCLVRCQNAPRHLFAAFAAGGRVDLRIAGEPCLVARVRPSASHSFSSQTCRSRFPGNPPRLRRGHCQTAAPAFHSPRRIPLVIKCAVPTSMGGRFASASLPALDNDRSVLPQ